MATGTTKSEIVELTSGDIAITVESGASAINFINGYKCGGLAFITINPTNVSVSGWGSGTYFGQFQFNLKVNGNYVRECFCVQTGGGVVGTGAKATNSNTISCRTFKNNNATDNYYFRILAVL